MTDDELLKFTTGIEEKLGKDNSAMIADDLGILISANTKTQELIKSKDEEIKALKSNNDKLVSANANLLRQIPMGYEAPKKTEETETKTHFSFRDAFDENGNFKK